MASLAITESLALAGASFGIPCRRRPCAFSVAALRSVSKQLHCISTSIRVENVRNKRPLFPHGVHLRQPLRPLSAVGSGLDASITEPQELSLKDVKIVVESRDDDKINLRVDLTGEQTQKAFDDVLINLAKTAPPIPGFRRQKGGKTSKVPKSFLLQILGRERVTKFVIQEILSSTVADYVKKENLNVKNKVNTTQDAEELKSAFNPGSTFGFNVSIEFENETETNV